MQRTSQSTASSGSADFDSATIGRGSGAHSRMILYAFPVAPNPTRVRLYIAEKQAGGADLGIRESIVGLPAGEQNFLDGGRLATRQIRALLESIRQPERLTL